jgi:hypothetical protein
MQTTPTKANDLPTFLREALFAAFVAVVEALFKPLHADRAQQPAPVFTHVLNEKFRDGRPERELTRWQDSRRDIPQQEIDRRFARAKFEQTIAPYDAASREIMEIAWQFRPGAAEAPLYAQDKQDPAETFRRRLLVGAEPVKSPANLDRRPRPLTL